MKLDLLDKALANTEGRLDRMNYGDLGDMKQSVSKQGESLNFISKEFAIYQPVIQLLGKPNEKPMYITAVVHIVIPYYCKII